jgi:hypothetical protein
MGPSPEVGVVSTNQRVWDVSASGDRPREVPNLYVMDSSMFPTSVGANPMQSLYTFARIFSERFILAMEKTPPAPPAVEAGVASSSLRPPVETAGAPQPERIGPKSG